MKMNKLLCVVLAAIMAFSTLAIGVSAAEGIAKSDNVVFVANSGSDEAAGTAAAPVQSMQKAVEKLAATGGVIVVMGNVNVTPDNSIMPEHKGTITVTSYYDGVDYRAKINAGDATGARLVMTNSSKKAFALQGDYVFDYLNMSIPNSSAKNCIIAAYYHNVTFGANFATLFEGEDGTPWYTGTFGTESGSRTYPPILLMGQNVSDIGIEGAATVSHDVVINIAGGIWQSARIGDRDVPVRNTLDAKMTINVSGGQFTQWTAQFDSKNTNLCLMGVYQSCTSENFVGTINVTGGLIHGEISGFGTYGSASAGDAIENGSIVINILGGTFDRDYEAFGPIVQPSQYLPFGAAGLTFGEKASVTVNIDNSKVTLGGSCPFFTIFGREEHIKINLNMTEKNEDWIIGDDIPAADIKYGPLNVDAPTTEAPTTTAAPVDTTAASTTTAAPTTAAPTTTAAPSQAEPTPSTGDASVMVVFAAAAAICLAAVVVIKKREN